MNRHYVYCHINKKTSEVFYVGIGSAKKYNRAYSVYSRNKLWKSYVKKHGEYHVVILEDELSKDVACKKEIALIEKYGRICDGTGRLTNISLGGDLFMFGVSLTPEHIEKIANAHRGKKYSDERRKQMSESRMGKPSGGKGIKVSEEGRKNMSEGQLKSLANGRVHQCTGKKKSMETIAKISKTKTGVPSGRKGIPIDEETKKKISKTLMGNIPWNKGLKGIPHIVTKTRADKGKPHNWKNKAA